MRNTDLDSHAAAPSKAASSSGVPSGVAAALHGGPAACRVSTFMAAKRVKLHVDASHEPARRVAADVSRWTLSEEPSTDSRPRLRSWAQGASVSGRGGFPTSPAIGTWKTVPVRRACGEKKRPLDSLCPTPLVRL